MSNHEYDPERPTSAPEFSRRGFLAGAGAAAAGLTILRPELVWGYQANEKVDDRPHRLRRPRHLDRRSVPETWRLRHRRRRPTTSRTRSTASAASLNVKAGSALPGLAGYKRMLEAEDGRDRGRVSALFPSGTGRGRRRGRQACLSRQADRRRRARLQDRRGAAARQATSKGLCFLVDFQTRADQFYIEAIQARPRRSHRQVRLRRSHLSRRCSLAGPDRVRPGGRDESGSPPARLGPRQGLSGDIITEQNIHTLDVASWIMGQPPVCAFGHRRPEGPRLRQLLGHVQRHLQVSPTTSASPSVRASSPDMARSPKASSTACSAPKACWKPATAAR